MRMSSGPLLIVIAVCVLVAPLPALAHETGSHQHRREGGMTDRLFLGFAEEARVANRQWWEARLEVSDGDKIVPDSTILRGVAAFQPWNEVEVGVDVGFGNTDTSGSLPDGSGATDLDVWAKWFLGSDANDTNFAVGAIFTVPTGDDTAGLGNDAFALGAFGALRYHLPDWTLSAHLGVRGNGDAQRFGSSEVDGETSVLIGAGGVVPLSERLTLLIEAEYEGERFQGGEPDFRVLGGINLHGIGRGMIRAAAAAGLDDGAPDAQILFGYATEF